MIVIWRCGVELRFQELKQPRISLLGNSSREWDPEPISAITYKTLNRLTANRFEYLERTR